MTTDPLETLYKIYLESNSALDIDNFSWDDETKLESLFATMQMIRDYAKDILNSNFILKGQD